MSLTLKIFRDQRISCIRAVNFVCLHGEWSSSW